MREENRTAKDPEMTVSELNHKVDCLINELDTVYNEKHALECENKTLRDSIVKLVIVMLSGGVKNG